MLHLKRFEFDLEAMKNIKLNDRYVVYYKPLNWLFINVCDTFRCEFPLTLNMEAYTKEYLARQEMETANLRMSAVSLK